MNLAVAEELRKIKSDENLSAGINAASERATDFESAQAMELAGAAMVPAARDMITKRLNKYWANRSLIFAPEYAPEIIVGAGVHAAIYASVRRAQGFPKPVVLERGKVGGAFAVTDAPSFYLNSRNQPGQNGRPSRDFEAGLNFLPGAPVQPDMLSGREYHTNADIAFAVRAALAEHAEVYTGAEVSNIRYDGTVTLESGMELSAGRVIDARGLGDPSGFSSRAANGITVQTFPQFMASLDGMFPLKGLERVAVVGGGDSGKVAVEALLGIGPGQNSLTGLDFIRQIDWYGESLPRTRETWYATERGRYSRIGAYLTRDASLRNRYDGAERLRVFRERAFPLPAFNGALVGSRAYDRVILATGNTLETLGLSVSRFYEVDGNIAKDYDSEGVIFRVGPAAQLRFTDAEYDDGYADNGDNRVGIFRLAPRTAALAANLKEPANPYR